MTTAEREHLSGAQRIEEERHRQVALGYGRAHDADEHTTGELTRAALCYAIQALSQSTGWTGNSHRFYPRGHPPYMGGHQRFAWPFDIDSWRPSDDAIRNLEKAGALLAAEIDRLVALRDMGYSAE